jgi:hypothetical protein
MASHASNGTKNPESIAHGEFTSASTATITLIKPHRISAASLFLSVITGSNRGSAGKAARRQPSMPARKPRRSDGGNYDQASGADCHQPRRNAELLMQSRLLMLTHEKKELRHLGSHEIRAMTELIFNPRVLTRMWDYWARGPGMGRQSLLEAFTNSIFLAAEIGLQTGFKPQTSAPAQRRWPREAWCNATAVRQQTSGSRPWHCGKASKSDSVKDSEEPMLPVAFPMTSFANSCDAIIIMGAIERASPAGNEPSIRRSESSPLRARRPPGFVHYGAASLPLPVARVYVLK